MTHFIACIEDMNKYGVVSQIGEIRVDGRTIPSFSQ